MAKDQTTEIVVHNAHGWMLDGNITRAIMNYVAEELIGYAIRVDVYPQPHTSNDDWRVRVLYRGQTEFKTIVVQRPGLGHTVFKPEP